MNEVTATVAAASGALLFDLASTFPPDREYHDDGHHVNEAGARLKAHLFAEFFIQQGLVPEAGW